VTRRNITGCNSSMMRSWASRRVVHSVILEAWGVGQVFMGVLFHLPHPGCDFDLTKKGFISRIARVLYVAILAFIIPFS
jgi:hypothetical protein